MPMLRDPSTKYTAFVGPDLPDRTWPSKKLTRAPRWLSTDLRDGNQALASPLNIDQKWTFFQLLVKIGFKEIEVGFPAASDTDFRFTQQCVAGAPSDVWLQVMTPCRKDLISRTIEAVTGAKKVIISLYIATSDNFIDVVFNTTREQQLRTAVEHTAYLKSLTKDDPAHKDTQWALMWSPETFSDTDPDFAIEISRAVKEVWEPTIDVPIILNLPATVELSMPNIYADQVEIFSRGFTSDGDKVCVSLHTHNDRGSAIAATELGQLAGAKRVEGCLFGNGERTGNVDLVTLALNLYTQGIDPGLDFSDLAGIRKTVEELTKIPVHTRAPYAGDSVFLAYSGGHQDAISKGFKRWNENAGLGRWKVPYLPIDPRDIGGSYEAVIRLNSQSGKGGVGYVLQQALNLEVPKELLHTFSHAVKIESEIKGRDLEEHEIIGLFRRKYGADKRVLSLSKTYHTVTTNGITTDKGIRETAVAVRAVVLINNLPREIVGYGETVLEAVKFGLSALADSRLEFNIECTSASGPGQKVNAVVAKCTSGGRSSWGVEVAETTDDDEVVALAALSAALGWNEHLPLTHQRLRLLPIFHHAPAVQAHAVPVA